MIFVCCVNEKLDYYYNPTAWSNHIQNTNSQYAQSQRGITSSSANNIIIINIICLSFISMYTEICILCLWRADSSDTAAAIFHKAISQLHVRARLHVCAKCVPLLRGCTTQAMHADTYICNLHTSLVGCVCVRGCDICAAQRRKECARVWVLCYECVGAIVSACTRINVRQWPVKHGTMCW